MSEQTQNPPATPATTPDNSAEVKTLKESLSQYQSQLQSLQQEKEAVKATAAAEATRLEQSLARAAVRFEAARQGIVNHGLADVLPIDGAKVDRATGTVSGADQVIAAWRERFPQVFAAGSPVVQPATQPAPTQTAPQVPPPAPPQTFGTPTTTFGPGAAIPPSTPAPVLDVRTKTKDEYQKLRADLYKQAAKDDGVTASTAALSLRH
jgi:hypothetical protein